MAEKFYNSEKFQKIFYPFLYFILAVAFIVTGSFVFYRTYYTNVYVSGSSMMPTLVGGNQGRWHYGISDNHEIAIKNLKRFDVALTYYPSGWIGGDEDTTYKIKRVWGLPGETISLTKETDRYVFTVKEGEKVTYTVTGTIEEKTLSYGNWKVASFDAGNKVFNTHADTIRTFELTLSKEKQEYFLMGDNWSASSDSYTHLNNTQRITMTNLQGKVIAIQGTAKLSGGDLVDKQKIQSMYNF
ncbi:MAG: S26 family signal peptidase [Bacilli bacterium]|nr:S26 family signal peptidase [Bacilli bacterium]